MIYEESEEETSSKTTHITTNMCEYDDDIIDENDRNPGKTANRNKKIQEQDIEMILEV